MIHRDKVILEQLRKFRVMTRDQLISLNFMNQKQPVVTCNRIMKRLTDRGHVKVNKQVIPFDYFHADSKVNTKSSKLAHFKAITDFVISARGQLVSFEVEPKLGDKGTVEPDLFMIWNHAPFFVEIQNSRYTKKQMERKLERYRVYFYSNAWRTLPWQPQGKCVFPYVWIVSEAPYDLPEYSFKVYQSKDVESFINKYMKKGNQ